MANSNAYMRKYMLERYHDRRKSAIESLGGKCVYCGATELLELDHINCSEKSFEISAMWSIAEAKFLEELKKCQVLCRACHLKKSIADRGQVLTKGANVHGTISSYRYCKCDVCKKAKNEYMRRYKVKKKMQP